MFAATSLFVLWPIADVGFILLLGIDLGEVLGWTWTLSGIMLFIDYAENYHLPKRDQVGGGEPFDPSFDPERYKGREARNLPKQPGPGAGDTA